MRFDTFVIDHVADPAKGTVLMQNGYSRTETRAGTVDYYRCVETGDDTREMLQAEMARVEALLGGAEFSLTAVEFDQLQNHWAAEDEQSVEDRDSQYNLDFRKALMDVILTKPLPDYRFDTVKDSLLGRIDYLQTAIKYYQRNSDEEADYRDSLSNDVGLTLAVGFYQMALGLDFWAEAKAEREKWQAEHPPSNSFDPAVLMAKLRARSRAMSGHARRTGDAA